MTATLEAYTDLFPRVTAAVTNDDAQDEKELLRVEQRLLASGLAVRAIVLAPMVRAIKPWSIVQVWARSRLYGYTYDPATDTYTRLSTGRLAWVEKIQRTADPNGWHGMEATLAFPPAGLWKRTR
jgi:hypothetical protein